MYKLYRIKARPFWDHWQTASSFYGTMLSLGSLLIVIIGVLAINNPQSLIKTFSFIAALGLAMEAIGLYFHAKDLKTGSGEGAAAHYEQTTTYGKTYLLRNGLLAFNLALTLIISFSGLVGIAGLVTGILLAISLIIQSYLGRIIFYALVIPTTMPGAFFWKNKGFIEHARESGLADMQQLGVAYEKHHEFDIKDLMQTVNETSVEEMFAQAKTIMTGK